MYEDETNKEMARDGRDLEGREGEGEVQTLTPKPENPTTTRRTQEEKRKLISGIRHKKCINPSTPTTGLLHRPALLLFSFSGFVLCFLLSPPFNSIP